MEKQKEKNQKKKSVVEIPSIKKPEVKGADTETIGLPNIDFKKFLGCGG